MILNLEPVESETAIKIANDFGLNHLYMGEYEGERYIGRFVKHTVAEIPELTSWNLKWDSSLFPNGIPFESFDKVWVVSELS